MKSGRIGVWFSLALAILLASAWLGSQLGERIALYRYRSAQHESLGALSASEHAHLESVLDELDQISFLRMDVLISLNIAKLKKTLPEHVASTESFGRSQYSAEVKPIADMNLALTHVVAAIVDEQDRNKERAANHVRSAQGLFQSLGWRDYSEDTLKTYAQSELKRWALDPRTGGGAK